jgi:hypothetical protein
MTPAMPQVQQTFESAHEIARRFNINFFTEAYRAGQSVETHLERLNPSKDMKDDDPDKGLGAFGRVVKAAGIRLNPAYEYGYPASEWGECTDTPEKRAITAQLMCRIYKRATTAHYAAKQSFMDQRNESNLSTRAVLLSGDVAVGALVNPWYDNPEIRAMRLVPPVPLDVMVARTTPIDGDAYRSLFIVDALNTDAYRFKRVTEGAEIPSTSLVTAERTIRIHKFGRAIRASYEQLRRQRIDRIAFLLARMAIQVEVDKVTDALNTIINGDGNANTSAVVLNQTNLHPGSTAGTLTLQSWQTFKLRFSLTYAPNIVLAQEASLVQLLNLPVGGTVGLIPMALMPPNAFGVVGPINDYLSGGVRYGLTADAPALKLVAFQNDLALERVIEVGGNVSEVERFIGNQTQMMTMTEVEGFAVIDPNSSKILNINA